MASFAQGFGSGFGSNNNKSNNNNSNASKPHVGDANKLAELTLLTTAAAKECFAKNNNDLYTALASFVQSQQRIPDNYFSTPDKEARKEHGKQINDRLRTAYEIVQTVADAARVETQVAWQACAKAEWNQKKAIEEAGKLATSKNNINNSSAAASSSSSSIKNIYAQSEKERYTGSFFDMPGFWEQEIIGSEPCTLVNMNKGFLEKTPREELRQRLLKWVEKSPQFYAGDLPFCAISDPDENTVRVIILDAVRTFKEDAHRKKLTEFLYMFSQELKSYGQAMAYLASVCLLVLTEHETCRVLRMVGKDYIRGHWATEAKGFATNAWVIEHFMQKRMPDVAKHLMKMNWWPDMYMQKILSGLCIHVLPWEQMFRFLDNVMEKGFPYLVQFELALVEHFAPRLLKLDHPMQANNAFEILKLDYNVVEGSDINSIFKKADENEEWVKKELAASDLPVLRSDIFDQKLAKRLEQAVGEDFEPCDKCDKEKPVWWCNDNDMKLCDGCHKKYFSNFEVEKY